MATKIKNELVDELLKDTDPKKVFSSEGLLADIKKALAERMLNAEICWLERQWKRRRERKWLSSAVGRPACFCPIFSIETASTASCWNGRAAHVLGRIRAGVLEAGTVELLREVGLGTRMDREGHPHDGSAIAWEGRPRFFIDTKKFTGKAMMAYGQTAITEDLYAARDAAGGQIIDEAGNVRLHELTSGRPYVTYEKEGSSDGSTAIMSPAATAIMA